MKFRKFYPAFLRVGISGLFVFCIVIIFIFPVYAQSLRIVTEEFPPYNYTEGNKITGSSTEVVRATLKELKIEADIEIYPWSRSYGLALKNKNTLIYSIGRNSTRENQFKWVGVIAAPVHFYLFALKKREDIQPRSLDDAKKYTIGTVLNDVREQYLKEKGFTHLESSSFYGENFDLLMKNKIDLWAMPELVAYYHVKKQRYPPNKILKKAYHLDKLSTAGYYMAFSKDSSEELVQKFRKALETIKENGTYQKILNKYLN